MKEGLTHDERKAWARTLYTTNGKSIKEVAITVNVDEAAVRQWIDTGNWNQVRRSLLISRNSQLECIYAQLEKLTEKMQSDESNPKDIDQLVKYTNAIKNLDTDNTSIYTLIDAAEQFITWLHHRDLDLAQLFTTQFDLFIKSRMATQA